MKSILQNEKECFICKGTYALDLHHVIYGTANRQKSDDYGLTVWLCRHHHTGKEGVHRTPNKGYDLKLKQYAQKKFEETYGDREFFIKEFGRSYL